MPYRKVVKFLRKYGVEPVRQRGSHVFMRHPDGRTTVVVDHGGRDIPPGLVRKILGDAKLDPGLLR